MSEQFKDQGGVASMAPSPFKRWLMSRVITHLNRPSRLSGQRAKIEKHRLRSGHRHRVEYFHQVDDGYSYLAAQVLPDLANRYDIELVCHLVSGPRGNNAAEPELLLKLSRYDAHLVAPEYGLEFPEHCAELDAELVQLATQILANLNSREFVKQVVAISRALWSDDKAELLRLQAQLDSLPEGQARAVVARGNARREQLKHYSGAMFYYGKEWYWGVDRLYHLEERLAHLGADKLAEKPMLVPRPAVESGPLKDNGSLTLEIYPSLRSPYTAISFDRTVQLANDTGVNLVVRPVLPMVMRGVPATREKGLYIFSDTVREAHSANVAFDKMYDPIGDPVRRAYSLYPWACEQGKGNELLSAFLRCAFVEGVNTNNNKGLRRVVENAGLDWSEARSRLGQPGWEQQLEVNRLAMYEAGLWGVPSYRLLDKQGQAILALWGQDRLWLVAREIQRRLA
jgi:2-hydroxychromene-2-carboxylate isomerase